jgi:hypothetical protein
MRFDIGYQIPEALTRMMVGTQVMHIAKARSMGLARGQEVGNQSRANRGWAASHCSTALA